MSRHALLALIPALALSAAATAASAQQAAPSVNRAGLRMLTLPGKVSAPGERQMVAQPASFTPPPRQAMYAPAPVPAARPAVQPAMAMSYQPVQARRPVFIDRRDPPQLATQPPLPPPVALAAVTERAPQRAAPPAVQVASLPTSIYGQAAAQTAPHTTLAPQAMPPLAAGPAPARAPVVAQAQAAAGQPRIAMASVYDQRPHYYSLHRAYGDTPDPVTLSPQFLSAPSTDLAEPPPPVMPRLLPGSGATAAQQTAARVQQRAASDSAS
jgi:hypothetical protein